MFAKFFMDPVPDMQTAICRVRRGAAFLQRVYGPDWYDKAILPTRNRNYPLFCVARLMFNAGHWKLVLMSLTAAKGYGLSCGFWDFLFYLQPPWVGRSHDRLTEAWKLVLQELRAAEHVRCQKAGHGKTQYLICRRRRRDSDSSSWSCII